jgi:uncharacterized protein
MNLHPEATPLIRRGWLRAVIFCMCYLLVFIIAGSIYASLERWLDVSAQAFFFLSFLVSFLFSLLTVYVFRRVFDNRSFISLGFEWKGHQRHAMIGLLLGLVLLGVESLILYFTGHLAWTGVTVDVADLLSGLIIMILVAVSEEVVFRGYLLNNLMQSVNKWVALGITALLFASFHAGNPGITLLALLNIFLSGLLLGLNYIYTKNLWFAIVFHFSWNFFLGPVLGYEVSGLPLNSLLQQNIEGPGWLTGGEFGLEGSVLDGIFSIIAFVLLMLAYNRNAAHLNANADPTSVSGP